jgi:hypothetical protein
LSSTKPESDQVVQLDDVLLALPSSFSVDSWADAKLRLIGLMKNTGHSRAFIRTSKAPPSHAVYWAKVICPECPSFIIGSASAANFKALSVNSQGHKVCTRIHPAPTVGISNTKNVTVDESWLCGLCGFGYDGTADAAQCANNIHKFCPECFEGFVKFKVTGEERAKFISSGCKMRCPGTGCEQLIDMRVCAPYIGTKVYDNYVECISETQIILVQKECELRLKEAKSSVAETIGASADATTIYVEHIAENLILPRCPTQSCRKWISDFDACSALKCGRTAQNADDDVTGEGCGAHFCAWCLTICSDKAACHRHVGQCPFNPADGCANS